MDVWGLDSAHLLRPTAIAGCFDSAHVLGPTAIVGCFDSVHVLGPTAIAGCFDPVVVVITAMIERRQTIAYHMKDIDTSNT